LPRCLLIDILYESFSTLAPAKLRSTQVLTFSRILRSKEVEVPIEISHVIVFQNIASYAQFKEGRSRNEGGETHLIDTKIELRTGRTDRLRTRRAKENEQESKEQEDDTTQLQW
jgi:hypothetical protein